MGDDCKTEKRYIKDEGLNKEAKMGVTGERHESARKNWQSFWSIIKD